MIGLAGDPALRGGKLSRSFLVARIP